MGDLQTEGRSVAFGEVPLPWRPRVDTSRTFSVALVDQNALRRECAGGAFELACPNSQIHLYAHVELLEAADEYGLIVHWVPQDRVQESAVGQSIARLRAAHVEVPVLVLLDGEVGEQQEARRELLACGASGVVFTSNTGIETAAAIVTFIRDGGHLPVRPAALGACDEPSKKAAEPPSGRAPRLTKRERAVLSLLYRGQANKIIAYRLGMSESTVKIHMRSILRKMGATNRTEAVYQARKLWSRDEIASLGLS